MAEENLIEESRGSLITAKAATVSKDDLAKHANVFAR